MTPSGPSRGDVYFADLPEWGDRPVVIVSNNARNRALQDVLAAKITTAAKPPLPSIVTLPDGEPVVGRVMCDDLASIPKSALRRLVGPLSQETMRSVDKGLRVALAL